MGKRVSGISIKSSLPEEFPLDWKIRLIRSDEFWSMKKKVFRS